MKQLIALLLSITTTLAGLAANDNIVVNGVVYAWSASDQGYIVTGWDEETPISSLHILGEVNELDVYGIAEGAFNPQNYVIDEEVSRLPQFESVLIDDGITFIGNDAFIDCAAIEWIRMPSTLTTIGNGAFARCLSLKHAFLNEGLTTIGEDAFYSCTSLTTMVIPSTVTEIQAHAFLQCTSVTDVFFLMNATQLANFNGWWDGIYKDENNIGGTEFNGSRLDRHNPESGTHLHVPNGMLTAYVDSHEFDEWLIEEDGTSYPLWWIVNYGVEGREYTVDDALKAVYADVLGGLYAKDDNHWLTPDIAGSPEEIDYMKTTGLMNRDYDQSNWVVLTGITDAESFKNYIIKGNSITGTLRDKKNPTIEVSDDTSLEKIEDTTPYTPNTYIPASFMSRTQLGVEDKIYAFVQPKPQELIHVEWTIYNADDKCFYLPTPKDNINTMDLKGGFRVSYDLYEQPSKIPVLTDYGAYVFDAINRRITSSGENVQHSKLKAASYEPYTEGGVSDKFIAFPLSLPSEPITTAITSITTGNKSAGEWYSIDGRYLGKLRPSAPGIYLNGGRKIIIK